MYEEDLSQEGGESEDSGIPARKNVNISLTWPSSADNLTHKKTWYIATYHRKVFILRYFGTLFFPLITLKSLALKRRSTLDGRRLAAASCTAVSAMLLGCPKRRK